MSPSTQVVDAAKLREEVQARMKGKIGNPGGDKIKLSDDKEFILPTGVKSKGPLTCVALDFVAYNTFFDRPFARGSNTPAAPACFAIGAVKPNQLVPSKASPVLQDEGKGCMKCWANQFKSAPNGVGKACHNHYRIAVVEANDNPEAPVWLIEPGAKTIRHWETYVATQDLRGKLLPDSIIEVSFDPNEPRQVLRFMNPKPNPNADMHIGRLADVLARLLVEPDVSSYEPPAKPGPKR